MKKILLLIMLIVAFSTQLFAQANVKELLDSINWDSTSALKLPSIQIGLQTMNPSIETDSITGRIRILRFSPINKIGKETDALEYSKEMDASLIALFGRPDHVENDLESEYVRDLDRKWYKDNYIIEVVHMIFPSTGEQIYSLRIEGIEKSEAPDFRVARWGDSKASVMEKEGEPNSSSHERIYSFQGYVAGMSCEVVYIFTKDKLTMAKYIFNESHTNKNDYIQDYKNLVELLSEKYGNTSSNPRWKNSLYKDDPDEYGFAVSLGHLEYSAFWSIEKTTYLTSALYGGNYEITLMAQYSSVLYDDLQETQAIQDKTQGL